LELSIRLTSVVFWHTSVKLLQGYRRNFERSSSPLPISWLLLLHATTIHSRLLIAHLLRLLTICYLLLVSSLLRVHLRLLLLHLRILLLLLLRLVLLLAVLLLLWLGRDRIEERISSRL